MANTFLATVISFFETTALSIWSKVSGSLFTIINEVADDEVLLIHDVMHQFTSDLQAGKTWGEAAADAWTMAANREGVELSKVGNLLLQVFIAKLEPAIAAAATGA